MKKIIQASWHNSHVLRAGGTSCLNCGAMQNDESARLESCIAMEAFVVFVATTHFLNGRKGKTNVLLQDMLLENEKGVQAEVQKLLHEYRQQYLKMYMPDTFVFYVGKKNTNTDVLIAKQVVTYVKDLFGFSDLRPANKYPGLLVVVKCRRKSSGAIGSNRTNHTGKVAKVYHVSEYGERREIKSLDGTTFGDLNKRVRRKFNLPPNVKIASAGETYFPGIIAI